MSQPNILFIITDQQRAADTGFMGNQVVRTPSMDKIAAQGMVFENAWVANPVCMPNRSSILTGRMPTAHGVIFNDRSLDWGANTFARQFRKAGYRTGLLGKSHLQHGTSRNSMVPFRGEGVSRNTYPEDWDGVEHFERYVESAPQDPEDFYGFERVRFSLDHGARVSGHHYRWALEQGADSSSLLTEYGEDAPGSHQSSEWWQIYQPPYGEELHSTTFVANETIKFIEESASQKQPFLAWCSFPDPHHPMTPPGDWFFRHKPEDMVLPESRHDSLEDAPKHLQLFKQIHPKDQRNWVAPCGYGSDELLKQAIAATYGSIEMIDHEIGRILAVLESLNLQDDTIIVFTSDHGDMMGEHGLFLKGFMHYRGTLQVPMVISVPGKKAGRSNALSSSIDLGVSLLDICGLDSFAGMQGKSLAPLLDDPTASVRDYVLVEDDLPDITAEITPFPGKTRTLITEEFRFTRNIKGEEQLFDLRTDPDEMHDLKIKDSAARLKMVDQLATALLDTDDANRGAPAMQSF